MTTDERLITGCTKGNRKMQRELYERYAPQMMVVALRYSKMQQEAEDILQEAFIKVFDKIGDFRRQSSLYYWIKRIVINTALNHQRSKLYLYPMVDVEKIDHEDRSEFSLAGFQAKELLEMVHGLPTGSQVIFNLYAIEGYKHKEIAELLNISEGTSKSQYARARELLRDKILATEKASYGRAE